MMLKRLPRPALRPFVETLWVTDETHEQQPAATRREHVLPTGLMHLVFRLANDPLRLFKDASDTVGETVGDALVGGARTSFYIREFSRPLCSVGAQLHPGAAQALFGMPADELAGRHTRLDDLWGQAVASIHEQLTESPVEQRLDVLEAILAERSPEVKAFTPPSPKRCNGGSRRPRTSKPWFGGAGTVTGRSSRSFGGQWDSHRSGTAGCCGFDACSGTYLAGACRWSIWQLPLAIAIKLISIASFGSLLA